MTTIALQYSTVHHLLKLMPGSFNWFLYFYNNSLKVMNTNWEQVLWVKKTDGNKSKSVLMFNNLN